MENVIQFSLLHNLRLSKITWSNISGKLFLFLSLLQLDFYKYFQMLLIISIYIKTKRLQHQVKNKKYFSEWETQTGRSFM